MKTLWILMMAILVVAVAAIPTPATDFEFTGNGAASGTWDPAENWDPEGGPPMNGDRAIIPDGKTCRIEDATQKVDSIDVQSGGTLGIIGKQLWISQDTADSTVDGVFYIKEVNTDTLGGVLVDGDMTITGSGTITGKRDDGYGRGVFRSLDIEFPSKLTIDVGLTVIGTLTFIVDLDNDATFIVDDGDDELIVGAALPLPVDPNQLTGDGTYDVSAGLLSVGYLTFEEASVGPWDVSGGTMHVVPACVGCNQFVGNINLSGGTLDVDARLCTNDVLDFSGGTIDVADGETAIFSGVCLSP